MGKQKGRQRDTAFTLLGDSEFREDFYDRRHTFQAAFRLRVEREAKGARYTQCPETLPLAQGCAELDDRDRLGSDA